MKNLTNPIAQSVTDNSKHSPWLEKSIPWLVGGGLALSHLATASNCSLPQQGKCTTCGSCVFALGTLVTWAILKKPKDGELYRKP